MTAGEGRIRRLALGLAYRGDHYHGWQSQPSGRTVQDKLEAALGEFAAMPVSTRCAGRTDTGVHGLNQVVHFDTPLDRPEFSWVRGTNRYLPHDIAVQWCRPVAADFHARSSARTIARTVPPLPSAHCRETASTFSGWAGTMSVVAATIDPQPAWAAVVFHGSPAQNPSMCPRASCSVICGGGTTQRRTSVSGSSSADASHSRSR